MVADATGLLLDVILILWVGSVVVTNILSFMFGWLWSTSKRLERVVDD
jgi:hypothetical protein